MKTKELGHQRRVLDALYVCNLGNEFLQPLDPVSDENGVKVVPHPPLGRQVEGDSRVGTAQLLVQLQKVAVATLKKRRSRNCHMIFCIRFHDYISKKGGVKIYVILATYLI